MANYDLSRLNVDTRYSDLGKRKVVDGVGYSDEVFKMNKVALMAPVERNSQLPAPYEYEEQAKLFAMADARVDEYPMLAMMFAIPNGQYRDGQRMEPGLKPGVPDIFLPYPIYAEDNIWYGLFIELKRADRSNDTSPEQDMWIGRLRIEGYKAEVAYGANDAWDVIMIYLKKGGA